jgi:hypothetical protein
MLGRDPLLDQWVQGTALNVHDASERLERVEAQSPEPPPIADPESPTADERASIEDYATRFSAWQDQRAKAKGDLADARRAHADAQRLANGLDLTPHGSEASAGAVVRRGATSVRCAPATPAALATPTLVAPRMRSRERRERHVARATSSSDSGDDGPSDPADDDPRLARLWRALRRARRGWRA